MDQCFQNILHKYGSYFPVIWKINEDNHDKVEPSPSSLSEPDLPHEGPLPVDVPDQGGQIQGLILRIYGKYRRKWISKDIMEGP